MNICPNCGYQNPLGYQGRCKRCMAPLRADKAPAPVKKAPAAKKASAKKAAAKK